MTSYPWGAALTNLWVTAVVVVLTFAVALFVAVKVRGGRHDGIDVVWGAGFGIVAIASLLLSLGDGDLWRQLLITVLTCVWGFRLAWHIERRNRGTDEDPRYVEIQKRAEGHPVAHMVRKVYVPQVVIMWIVSLPVQLGMYGYADGVLAIVVTVLGVLSWGTGFYFESVGDAQLAAFKADPASKGQVMDSGLWRYTRHPNYFGGPDRARRRRPHDVAVGQGNRREAAGVLHRQAPPRLRRVREAHERVHPAAAQEIRCETMISNHSPGGSP